MTPRKIAQFSLQLNPLRVQFSPVLYKNGALIMARIFKYLWWVIDGDKYNTLCIFDDELYNTIKNTTGYTMLFDSGNKQNAVACYDVIDNFIGSDLWQQVKMPVRTIAPINTDAYSLDIKAAFPACVYFSNSDTFTYV